MYIYIYIYIYIWWAERNKEIDIKNSTYYDFNDIIKVEDFDPDILLIDEKSYENILVYNIWYKKLIDCKPRCITFDKIDGFIRVYDRTRYLVLFVNCDVAVLEIY